MAYAASGGAAAAAVAAIAQAIKASGAIVRLEPDDFIKILAKASKPLVVIAKGGFLRHKYRYLTTYKGLVFFTKSPSELMLPGDAEIITAREMWIPD